MFLSSLKKPEQKTAFMQLARSMMAADGVLHENEQSMLELMRRELDLPSDYHCQDLSVEQSLTHFETREEQTGVILELVALALADASIAPSEHDILQSAIRVFNYPSERVLSMEDWVRRYCELVREAARFFV